MDPIVEAYYFASTNFSMILIYYCVGEARIARLYAVADGDARIAVSRDASNT
jgi:hypothetical protein